MSAALSKKAEQTKKNPHRAEQIGGRKAFWNVEIWTQGGNFVGFRIVRGNGESLEVAKSGGFVVDPTVPSSNPRSRANMREAAIKQCDVLNKEIHEGKMEERNERLAKEE